MWVGLKSQSFPLPLCSSAQPGPPTLTASLYKMWTWVRYIIYSPVWFLRSSYFFLAMLKSFISYGNFTHWHVCLEDHAENLHEVAFRFKEKKNLISATPGSWRGIAYVPSVWMPCAGFPWSSLILNALMQTLTHPHFNPYTHNCYVCSCSNLPLLQAVEISFLSFLCVPFASEITPRRT